MQEPEENRRSFDLDLSVVGDILDIGSDLASDGVLDGIGSFLGDAVGGILDGISIDI